MSKKLIVTHQNPDVDAIGSVWLLKRFDREDYFEAKTSFVPAGETISEAQLNDLGISLIEVTHVDTGMGEFDHHSEEKDSGSAAELVFNYLKKKHADLERDGALARVVTFINETDHFGSYFWPEPTADRYIFTLEQMLNGYKLGGHGDDHDLVELGMKCLDGAYSMMKIVLEAREELTTKGSVFETVFGKALGITSSNDAVIKQGQKMGYTIVVRKDPELGNIRIKAAPLPEIDLTRVYEAIRKRDTVGTWYFHPGKHMLINGSRKHIGQVPSPLSLEDVIGIIRGIS